RELEVHAPRAGIRRGEYLVIGQLEVRGGCHGSAAAGGDADDNRLAAAVLEELLHRIAHRAVAPQPAELPLVVCKTVDGDRLVDQPAPGASDKGGDRGRHPRDGAHAAWKLFDIDAGICQGYWHR